MLKLKLPKIKGKIAGAKFPRLRKFNYWTFLALLSYLNILVVFPLFFSKKNDFVKYHAKQGISLFLFTAIGLFSFYIPYLPWLVILFVAYCIIFGIVNVFTSREKSLPLLGKWALPNKAN